LKQTRTLQTLMQRFSWGLC